MKAFFISLGVATAGLGLTAFGLRELGIIATVPSSFWEILAFLLFGTGVLFYYVYRAPDGLFVQVYLLSLVIKLLASGVFVFLLLYKDRPNAIPNAVTFLLVYVIFTALEIVFLYRKPRS